MVDAIETKLATESWLGGQQPSKDDAEAFTSLAGVFPSAATHPNACAWFMMCWRMNEDVRGSWTVAAPAAAAGVSI